MYIFTNTQAFIYIFKKIFKVILPLLNDKRVIKEFGLCKLGDEVATTIIHHIKLIGHRDINYN